METKQPSEAKQRSNKKVFSAYLDTETQHRLNTILEDIKKTAREDGYKLSRSQCFCKFIDDYWQDNY